ncbi:MAG: M28 family peptidase [Planctomycetota bacterium]
MKSMTRVTFLVLTALALSACGDKTVADTKTWGDAATVQGAEDSITPEGIKAHIKVLADDDMEGRGPGTIGAARARDYLISKLKAAGAKPGGAKGKWGQDVPMRRIVTSKQTMRIRGLAAKDKAGFDWTPKYGKDYVLVSNRGAGEHAVDAELVFVGHGAEAPEYEWNDFEGLDCKGKILVMLVGDPPTADQDLFGGAAMTYYGRWTYKFDKARELGAAGCLVVHKTPWAGYGWAVVFNSWRTPRFDIRGDDPSSMLGARGWVTWATAEKLVSKTGRTLDELAAASAKRGFVPVPLGLRAQTSLVNEVADLEDVNVVALMEGSDAKLKAEWIIYTAHYDHLGAAAVPEGKDGIYNGAIDNASGCGGILALAEAWGKLDPKPKRSAMFLFVGSEEKGLLGSRWFAEHPTVPLENIVANINVDGINVHDETKDVEVIGSGQNDLEQRLIAVLKKRGRHVLPDSESEKGYYYRSDHFNFARVGVPALYIKGGQDMAGKPADFVKKARDVWRKNHYHRPSDEFDPAWSLKGGCADIRALFRLGVNLGMTAERPQWSETSEFRPQD